MLEAEKIEKPEKSMGRAAEKTHNQVLSGRLGGWKRSEEESERKDVKKHPRPDTHLQKMLISVLHGAFCVDVGDFKSFRHWLKQKTAVVNPVCETTLSR